MTNNPEEGDFYDPFVEPMEIEVTDSLDLHAFAPKDIKRLVENYLLEASQKGFSLVRIIHGKGIGIQREIVRSILEKSELVESFSDAETWGATIARLKQKG